MGRPSQYYPGVILTVEETIPDYIPALMEHPVLTLSMTPFLIIDIPCTFVLDTLLFPVDLHDAISKKQDVPELSNSLCSGQNGASDHVR